MEQACRGWGWIKADPTVPAQHAQGLHKSGMQLRCGPCRPHCQCDSGQAERAVPRKPSVSTLDSAPAAWQAAGRCPRCPGHPRPWLCHPVLREFVCELGYTERTRQGTDLFSSLLSLSKSPRPCLGCFVLPGISWKCWTSKNCRDDFLFLGLHREHQQLSKKAPFFECHCTNLSGLKPSQHHMSLKTKKNVEHDFCC